MGLKILFAEVFPITALNNRADELKSQKPRGFKPISKYKHRRACRDCYNSYEYYIEQKKSKRVLGNRNISSRTQRRMEEMRKEGGYGREK